MSRIVYLHPNRYVRPEMEKLVYQLRMWLWQTHGAILDTIPIPEPWAMDALRSAPFTGALVWNGYGNEQSERLVAWCEEYTGKDVVRLEQGWFPQKEHVYFSHGLGATSTLSREIESKRWLIDWPTYRAWTRPDLPKPGLPDDYILVCGQVPGDTNLVSLTAPLKDIPRLVRENTDYPVIYRPHPRHPEPCDIEGVTNADPDSDLLPQLAHARCVVAGTSTCLLEACWLGTPAIAMGLGVWTIDMIRHAIPQTLKYELARCTEGWDDRKRDYGLAVLKQHAEISKTKPRFRSQRIQALLEGLL